MILDIHTHCYPENLAAAALRNWKGPADVTLPDGTLSGLLRDLDKAGIDRAVVLHVAHKPGSARAVNDFAAEVQRTHGERLRCFGSIHPDAPDAVEELWRIKELGLHGVKLHPIFQNFDPTEERYFSLYREMGHVGLPVLFQCGKHPGYTIAFQPTQMEVILPYFQGTTVIGAHLCGLSGATEQLSVLTTLPIYVDLGYCARYFEPSDLSCIIKRLDEERILFGSDTPWDTAEAELKKLEQAGLSSRIMDKILSQNACELLNWPVSGQ